MNSLESSFINRIMGSHDSYMANLKLEENNISSGQFVEYLLQNYGIGDIFDNNIDIVAQVYLYILDLIPKQSNIFAYIKYKGYNNLVSNYAATHINYNLNDDDTFRELLISELQLVDSKVYNEETLEEFDNQELLDKYFENSKFRYDIINFIREEFFN